MGQCVLIIGAGGVGRVVAHHCARDPKHFERIVFASRTESKCQRIASELSRPVETRPLNADCIEHAVAAIQETKAAVVINVASPYQNLAIMEACRRAGAHYIDTSADDDQEKPKFDYGDQWAFDAGFKEAGLTGILSMGFDPGVVNVFCAYAWKHFFDEIHTIDIIDCNAGNHGHAFATNFDPETNIREIIAPGKYWDKGHWQYTEPLTMERDFHFPEIGRRQAKLIYHEELESIVTYIPGIQTARFWMTFSDAYLEYLTVMRHVGLTSSKPIVYEGKQVVPLQFLKKILPDPGSLGSSSKGKTCIGCQIQGIKDGQQKRILLYNVCEHEKAYADSRSQAVSFTTGVPAVLAAKLLLDDVWKESGVFCPEQMDPDPMMDALNTGGLPWHVIDID